VQEDSQLGTLARHLFSHSVTPALWALTHSAEHSSYQDLHWAALQPGYACHRSAFVTCVEEAQPMTRASSVVKEMVRIWRAG
jgi:hypothetical protein